MDFGGQMSLYQAINTANTTAFTVCLLVGREEKSRWEKEWGEGDRRKERRMGCKREGECDEDEQKYREWIVKISQK